MKTNTEKIDGDGIIESLNGENLGAGPGFAANSNEAGAAKQGHIEPHFKLVRLKDMKASREPAYLVKGLIPKYGLVVVWGEPKCGKTFWVLDVVTHIALGIEYRGRRVKQGQIVYISIEGTEGFKGRAEAICNKFLNDPEADPPFRVITQALNLIGDHKKLVADIKAQSDAPAAVVIDTLNRSLVGSESSDEDMAAYVKAADAVKDAFGCAVIVVHHCGHGGTRPRGHSSLIGALDTQIAIERDASDNVIATVEYMKDGPQGDRIGSRLEVVKLGLNTDGDEITSCTIAPIELGDIQPTKKSLTDREKLSLEALVNCAAEKGTAPPASLGLPRGLIAVSLEAWKDEIYSRGVLDRDAKNPREEFRRVRNKLQVKKLIAIQDDLVWVPPANPSQPSQGVTCDGL